MKGGKSNRIIPEEQTKDGREAESQWVTTKSDVRLRIRYLRPNNPDKSETKALIFIHGVGGSSDVWNSQLKYFSKKGYHVIAPDLIGHGFSSAPDKPSLYTFESIRQHCIDVFDQMSKEDNVIIGHSYGTSFAAYLAHHRREKVSKLVLMSGGAPVALGPQTGVLSLPSFLLSCFRPALSRLFYRNAFHKKSKSLPNKEIAFDVPLNVLRYTMKGQHWAGGDVQFHSGLSQPTLLLHGVDDKLEAASATLEMHEALTTSNMYFITDASHMIMMEQPVIVNKLLENFLSDSIATENMVERGRSPSAAPKPSQTNLTKSQPNLRGVTLTNS